MNSSTHDSTIQRDSVWFQSDSVWRRDSVWRCDSVWFRSDSVWRDSVWR